MLKFVKEHLETIDSVEIYPIFSLVIFFVMFSILIYKVLKTDNKEIDNLKQIPLDED